MTFCERVESRTLLAGNVSIVLSSDAFRLFGDAFDNAVSVVRSRVSGEFVVSGLNDTTIDGRATRTYTGRNKIFAVLGDGDDTLILDRIRGDANLSLGLGAGDDAVCVKRGLLGAADLFGETGDDIFDIADSTFAKRLRIFAGEQNDNTSLQSTRAVKGFEISDTAGRSIVRIDQTSGGAASWFSGSRLRDALSITDSHFNAFSAKLKAGNDGAFIRNTTFAQSSPIDGGSGSNDIDREVLKAWDFRNGIQGWQTYISDGFTTRPVGSISELAPATSTENGRVTVGLAALPTELGMDGQGVRTVAPGPYFPFVAKRLADSDGMVHGCSYQLAFDLTVATNLAVPTTDGNAELRVAAISSNPTVLVAEGGEAKFAADVGQIASAGKEGNSTTSPTFSFTRRTASPTSAVSYSANESITLIVGAKSLDDDVVVFPASTVFFCVVRVRLTPVPNGA